MPQKKIPMRMCNGCGEMKPKIELVRVVKSPTGEVSLDLKGKAPGRGAYICKNADCLKKAKKTGKMSRTLDVAIPDEIYLRMESELDDN